MSYHVYTYHSINMLLNEVFIVDNHEFNVKKMLKRNIVTTSLKLPTVILITSVLVSWCGRTITTVALVCLLEFVIICTCCMHLVICLVTYLFTI